MDQESGFYSNLDAFRPQNTDDLDSKENNETLQPMDDLNDVDERPKIFLMGLRKFVAYFRNLMSGVVNPLFKKLSLVK